MDALDELLGTLPKLKQKTAQLVSTGSDAVSQGIQQLKATPANVNTVSQGLSNLGIQAPSSWGVASSLNSAKDRLLGFWRGYIAPALR